MKMAFIARHAESKWNIATPSERQAATEIWRTNPLADCPLRDADLSERGETQIKQISINSCPLVEIIYCSPLTRAIRTALSLSVKLGGIPVHVHPALREVRRDVGDLGSLPAILKEKFPGVRGFDRLSPRWWMEGVEEPKTETRAGTCDCKEIEECAACVSKRIECVEGLVRSAEKSLLIVTHHDLIHELCGWAAGNAEIAQVELSPESKKAPGKSSFIFRRVPRDAGPSVAGEASAALPHPADSQVHPFEPFRLS
jgi:broad specificity phosphatase PhoE